MIGFDNIHIWLPRTSNTPDVTPYLNNGGELTDINTGEVRVYGIYKGLKVSSNTAGISIIGSLAKFVFGNNIEPATMGIVKEATQEINDGLHLDVSNGKITYLEFGANLTMSKPPQVYINKLGAMPRYKRIQCTDDGLYYGGYQGAKRFHFYNKVDEAKHKRQPIPPGFEGANLLRYELRLNKSLPKQIGIPEVTASTLSQLSTSEALCRIWKEYYYSIAKTNKMNSTSVSTIRTPGDAINVLMAQLLSQCDKSTIEGFINSLKSNHVFTDRKKYTRVKNKITEISNMAGVTLSDDDIKELDDEINNSGAYL